MRYYNITVTDPNGTQVANWTSYPNGTPDPNALQVEFDLQTSTAGAAADAGGSVTIYGVPLQMLQQAQAWNDNGASASAQHYTLTIAGGMGGGLPLENPQQQGLILSATIVAALGNWIGTEQTLTFIVQGDGFSLVNPGNHVLSWRKGTNLSDALQSMLSTVYGSSNVNVSLGGSYVQQRDTMHFAPTLGTMSEFVYDQTANMDGGPVRIRNSKGKVEVYDSQSTLPKTHKIAFTDLVGQPTWIRTNTMTLQLVMRGDLDLGDTIIMPQGPNGQSIPGSPGLVATQTSGAELLNQQATFQGQYSIASIRQIGNFRSSDSTQWSTVLQCLTNVAAS